MKTSKLTVILTFLYLAMSFISCSTDDGYVSSSVSDLENRELKSTEEDHEKLLELLKAAVDRLEEREIVLVSYGRKGYELKIVSVTSVPPPAAASGCSGSNAVKFAKCVDKLVKKGKCVTVSYDDGVYTGDVVPCRD